MAWWNRRPRTYPASVHRAEGVVAAAQRYDLDNSSDREALGKLQQQWQRDILIYADTIGEFIDAGRFVENSFRRIRLFAAFQRSSDEEPMPCVDATMRPDNPPEGFDEADVLDEKWATLAEEIIAGFAARDGGQAALVARLGVNLFKVGEAILVQRAVPERRPQPGEDPMSILKVWDWEVRSVFEIRKESKTIELVDAPDQRKGVVVEGIDGIPPYFERVWRKHWAWSAWSSSNTRAATGVLEELRLLDFLARASLRSRAMAGVWTVPEELDFSATDLPDGTPGPRQTISFDRTFTEAMGACISDEADPNTVAPLVVRGKSDFLKRDVFGPIEMPRRYGADERAQREDAVRRFGRTIELPQEKIVGVESINHWGVWAIDEDTYRAYVEPLCLTATEALTYGLVRPLLEIEGCPPEVLDRIVVAPDVSQLVRRADRGKLATEGYGLRVVSGEGWRRANGFGDDDAPDDDELLLRVALDARQGPDMAADLLRQAGLATVPELAAAPTVDGVDEDEGEEGSDREMPGTQDDAPPAMAAAVLARSTVGSRLAAIDSTLFASLLAEADRTVLDILKRVGARLRSRTKDAEMRAALAVAKNVPNTDLAAHLPLALVAAALGPNPVTVEDFADLRVRFERWTDAAQETAIRELARLAGDRLSDAQIVSLRAEQAQDRDEAWLILLAALIGYTESRLVRGEDELDTTGEWEPSAVIAPVTVWEALALAGGTAVEHTSMGGIEHAGGGVAGGPATGDVMRHAFAAAGHPFVGYEWEYGSAPRQTPFEPHLALDGAPEEEWGPYAPGDHRWCRCSSTPIVMGET